MNFKNPDVFIEIVLIIRRYLEQGVKIFRLDAVAFLWKEIGTSCIHLPQTHEFIRLFRTLIEAHTHDAIIITETNVPLHENLSYLGNANEAHAVYNFSLPPLLIHALITGTSEHLKRWQMSMPPAQNGTFYFNFIANHDGIGLRPINGLLDQKEIDTLIYTMQNFGAQVSWRSVATSPYAITELLKLRTKQAAFHPNSVQYTLHLGDRIFGFWRQSTDRQQSIFCIHNLSNQDVHIAISSINLISTQEWSDLVTGNELDEKLNSLHLQPYQFVWLSNKCS